MGAVHFFVQLEGDLAPVFCHLLFDVLSTVNTMSCSATFEVALRGANFLKSTLLVSRETFNFTIICSCLPWT